VGHGRLGERQANHALPQTVSTHIMLRTLTCLLIVLISGGAIAQSFESVDQAVKQYEEFRSVHDLSNRINSDFSTDIDKARAIYMWITHNIQYDVISLKTGAYKSRFSYTYKSKKEQIRKEAKKVKKEANYTFDQQMAVCSGYASLFKVLCDQTNLECEIVEGTSRTTISDLYNKSVSKHDWNAVKIDGKWQLIDSTWGAGHTIDGNSKFIHEPNDIYFLTPPDKFALKHYPSKRKWLFTKMKLREFKNLPLFYSTYLYHDIDLVGPTNMIIKDVSINGVHLRLNTQLDIRKFVFSFNNQPSVRPPSFKVNGDIIDFYIPSGGRGPKHLTLFYDGKAILTFRTT
jgi:transglutaminase/protease-like cytokinesis protein 3